MTRSELIAALAAANPHLRLPDAERVGKHDLSRNHRSPCPRRRGWSCAASAPSQPAGGRRAPAATPAPARAVAVAAKAVPHFKPGKELRERVNGGPLQGPLAASACCAACSFCCLRCLSGPSCCLPCPARRTSGCGCGPSISFWWHRCRWRCWRRQLLPSCWGRWLLPSLPGRCGGGCASWSVRPSACGLSCRRCARDAAGPG